MTPLSFFLGLLIVAVVLVLVRAFWMEIALALLGLYVLGQIIALSFISMILWAVFVTKSAAGWGWTFLFFFLTYCMMGVVYYMIVKDVFGMIGDALTSFFKRIK